MRRRRELRAGRAETRRGVRRASTSWMTPLAEYPIRRKSPEMGTLPAAAPSRAATAIGAGDRPPGEEAVRSRVRSHRCRGNSPPSDPLRAGSGPVLVDRTPQLDEAGLERGNAVRIAPEPCLLYQCDEAIPVGVENGITALVQPNEVESRRLVS